MGEDHVDLVAMLRRVVDDLREKTRRQHGALTARALPASKVAALNGGNDLD